LGTKTCHSWFFETKGTSRVSLVGQLQALFEEYKLTNNIICCVKDENTDLSTMINVVKHIVTCEELAMHAPFEGVCLSHALSRLANMPLLMKK
jgi:hypothetical protein